MKTLDRTVVNLIARRCLLEPPQNRHGLSESRQPTPTRKRDLLAYCTFSIVVIKPHCASLTTSLRQVGGEGRPQGGTHDSWCGAGAVKTRKPCWCERRDPRAPIPPGSNPDPKSTNSRKSLLRNVFVCRADFSVVASQVASHKPPICFLSLSLHQHGSRAIRNRVQLSRLHFGRRSPASSPGQRANSTIPPPASGIRCRG